MAWLDDEFIKFCDVAESAWLAVRRQNVPWGEEQKSLHELARYGTERLVKAGPIVVLAFALRIQERFSAGDRDLAFHIFCLGNAISIDTLSKSACQLFNQLKNKPFADKFNYIWHGPMEDTKKVGVVNNIHIAALGHMAEEVSRFHFDKDWPILQEAADQVVEGEHPYLSEADFIRVITLTAQKKPTDKIAVDLSRAERIVAQTPQLTSRFARRYIELLSSTLPSKVKTPPAPIAKTPAPSKSPWSKPQGGTDWAKTFAQAGVRRFGNNGK
jgi:hypothetical protein